MFPTMAVDVDAVPLEWLENEITSQAGHLAAATCRWLLLVAAFDRRQGYDSWQCRSTAHWLNWRCGLDQRSAYEHVRVARAIERLPQIQARFARGELSFSKVRALTRIATPATEGELAELAKTCTAAQLEKIVRAYRRATADEVTDANERHERRGVTWYWDDDGSLVVQGRLSPEDGALFLAGMAVARDRDECSAEQSREPRQRHADALVLMARMALTAEGSDDDGERCHVTVHVDAPTIIRDDDGRCHLDDGPALAPETARRLSCDAALIAIIEGTDGTIIEACRQQRAPNRALRRALKARDGSCRFPGCNNRAYLDAHHVLHWTKGGPTTLANLCLLCRQHHRAVHEGGWTIDVLSDGELQFRNPHGFLVPPPTMTGDPTRIHQDNDAAGIVITPNTPVAGWCGEHLDLDYITSTLCYNNARLDAAAAALGD
jgi:hypothetical protein